MSHYGTGCGDCQRCPECGDPAYCLSEPRPDIPCPHDTGYCGDCNLAHCPLCQADIEDALAGLDRAAERIGRDPFWRPDPHGDPWAINPARPDQRYNAAYHAAHRKDPA